MPWFYNICLSLSSLLLLSASAVAQGVVSPHEDEEHKHGFKFVENKNQWPDQVLYRAFLDNGSLWLEPHTLTYAFFSSVLQDAHANPNYVFDPEKPIMQRHAYKVNFLGAGDNTYVESAYKTSEFFNFYLGKDQSKWASHAYGYEQITYRDLYDGIDLKFYSKDEFLKYDFIVSPYVDAGKIHMEYEGADAIYLTPSNDLVVKTSVNTVVEQKPYAYQDLDDGTRVEVPCKFVLKDGQLSFKFPRGYDKTRELVIDPVVVFSTYSGSTANNFGMTATFDSVGNLFAGGITFSQGYPVTTGAYDELWNTAGTTPPGGAANITDVVITKYNATGTNQIYSTYLGGDESETVHSLIVNSQNELMLYGVTCSPDFPTTLNAYDDTYNGGSGVLNWVANGTYFTNGTDIFVSRFSEDGDALLASTYIGGSADDGVNYIDPGNSFVFDSLVNNYGDIFRGEIMVDGTDNVYIASTTRSSDFPIVSGFDNTLAGTQDGVVMKFDENLTTLTWSSFIGGSASDAAYAIKVTPGDTVYVAGGTASLNFPVTTGAYSVAYNGGEADGFAMKISPDGTTVINCTFLGLGLYDQAYFLEIDRNGQVFLYGQTNSAWPIVNAAYSIAGSGQFVTRLNEDLSAVTLSTVFGDGAGIDLSPAAFLIDICGNIYCTGWTGNLDGTNNVSNMPITGDAFQDELANVDGHNFYLIVMEREAGSLLYGSYFGSPTSFEHVDGGTSRFDKNGVVYQSACAGCQNDDNLPTTLGAWSNTNESTGCNNGLIKFDFEIVPTACIGSLTNPACNSDTTACDSITLTFQNASSANIDSWLWDFGNNDTTSIVLNPTRTFYGGTHVVTLLVTDSICLLTDTAYQTITVSLTPVVQMPVDSIFCDAITVTLTPSTFGTTSTFIWSSNANFTDTLNTSISDSTLTFSPSVPEYYYFMAYHPSCPVIDSVLIGSVQNMYTFPTDETMCAGDTVTLNITASPTGPIGYTWQPAGQIIGNNTLDSILVSPSTTTQYTVTALDTFGCVYLDTVTVNVTPFPIITMPNDTFLCDLQPITLSPIISGGTGSYIWSSNSNFSDTLNSPLSDSTLTFTPGATQYYYFMVDSAACLAMDSVLIGSSLNSYTFSTDQNICEGDTAMLSITTSTPGPVVYTWEPAGQIIGNNTLASILVSPSTTTQYTITALDSFGCVYEDTLFVNVTPYPIITMPNDTTVCDGQSVTLVPIISGGTGVYIWSSNAAFSDTLNSPISDSTLTFTPLGAQYYYIMVNNGACSAIDSVEVTAVSFTYTITQNQTLCLGDVTQLTMDVTSPGTVDYLWEPASEINGANNTSSVVVAPTSDVWFTVTAVDILGCIYEDSVFVTVIDLSGISIAAIADDSIILAGEITTVYATPFNSSLSYSWDPTHGLNTPNSASSLAAPLETTTYTVTISAGSCSETRSVTIYVIEGVCDEPDIYVANAFTPNGDGNNDFIYVHGNAILEMYFTIYDRWGEMMFETTDQSVGWDGTFKGMDCDPAVFDYYLDVTCVGNTKFFKKGNITLIR
jgi:gliding motility-associated-like protein